MRRATRRTVDPNTPSEETVGAMSKLVRDERVRFLGLSEIESTQLDSLAAPMQSAQHDSRNLQFIES